MQIRVMRNDKPFFGKVRNVGDVLSEDEANALRAKDAVFKALLGQGIIEVDGMAASVPGMSAADLEALGSLRASFDRFREDSAKAMGELHAKLEAIQTQISLIGVESESGTRKARKKG